MKTKNILTYLLIGALFLFTCACEGFLDQKPTNSTLSSEAITCAEDAQVAMNGVLRTMTAYGYYGRQFLLYADFKGGDLTPPSLGRGNDALFTFTHNFNLNAYGEIWDSMFYTLLQANNIISSIKEGSATYTTEEEKETLDDICGQALAVRALVHFDLARVYGYPYLKDNGASLGAPIVTRVLDAQDKLVRSSVAETYERAIADLKEALGLLNDENKTLGISVYAAKALLSRIYLYCGEWDNAFKLAEEVISSQKFTLYDNANWASSWNADFGTESIFELPVTAGENDLEGSSPTHLLRPYYFQNGASAAVASKQFFAIMEEDMEDIRWQIMDIEATSEVAGLVIGRKGWIKKYEKNSGTANNIKIVRLSEVYLIAAEAALKKGTQDKEKAVGYLNMIRKRSPSLQPATTDMDTGAIEDMIFRERRKELICEGHTYFDFLRCGKTVTFDETLYPITSEGRQLTVDWNFAKCVLPIPQAELLANPDIQQNPSYDRPR